MNREGHENVVFFHGVEVEHTPAYGKPTLFVVDVQPVEEIAKNLNGANHIYFGANHSFPLWFDHTSLKSLDDWKDMIEYFLTLGYLCSLDVDTASVEDLLNTGLCEYKTFIPSISVKLPYIESLGYNAVIKLDDTDFNNSNPGVWCHQVHDLMDRKVFTPWSDYINDEVV